MSNRSSSRSTIASTTAFALFAGALALGSPARALTDEEIAESDRLLQAGEFQSAEALYRAAFERDPNDAEAVLRLIYSLIVQERAREATQYMDALIERDYQFLSEFVGRWARYSHVPLAVMHSVLAIGDPQQREMNLWSAAAGWAQTDPAAAQDWILTLPVGSSRDAAVTGLALGLAADGALPSPAALSAYSSDATRQEKLLSIVMPLTARNAANARRLIDEQITDPARRESAERLHARALELPTQPRSQ